MMLYKQNVDKIYSTNEITFEFASVNLIIGSFFLKSHIIQRCENVEARICWTINENKNLKY